MFTNCIDDDKCTRDSSIDEILTNFVETNNKRMNLDWETNPNKWDNWESKYYCFYVELYIYIFIYMQYINILKI